MDAPPPRRTNASAGGGWSDLPPDLAADIHGRLGLLDRLAFTAVFGQAFKQEAPCLLLDDVQPFKWDTARIFSLVDRRAATVRLPDLALRHRVIIGSSGGWLVTADMRARMHMINPVTGEQAALPAITTMPFVDDALDPLFRVAIKPCRDARYGGGNPTSFKTNVVEATPMLFTADEIRFSFYSKVVLSATPRPGSYSAMLILGRQFGAPAFATSDDPAWRLAPSCDGIEDAIHHQGRFYSITFSGVVEAWEEHGGEFKSKVVTSSRSRLIKEDDHWCVRKYLAAGLDGRLIVLIKNEEKKFNSWMWISCFFTMQVLDEATQRWEEVGDIGEAALFVGVNSSLCVSTREHPELMAGCVYFTDDQLATAATRYAKRVGTRYGSLYCSYRDVGAYSCKDREVMAIRSLGSQLNWPPPAWFTPSFL